MGWGGEPARDFRYSLVKFIGTVDEMLLRNDQLRRLVVVMSRADVMVSIAKSSDCVLEALFLAREGGMQGGSLRKVDGGQALYFRLQAS